MKKILKLSSLAFLLIATVACENDDQTIVQAKNGPELISPLTDAAYLLTPENATNEATTLVWNHSEYSQQTEVNYTVEVALAGTDFATIISGGSTTNRFVTWTVEALNSVALDAGLVPYAQGELDVRIKAALGTNADLVSYSNVITLKVTPYTTETPRLWIPGSYQSDSGYGNNWTQSTAATLASEGYGNTNFEGYMYLANNVVADGDNGFKFSTQENWDGTNYGDDDSGNFTNISPTGVNIGANAGYYLVKVNTSATGPGALSYTLQPTSWAITGSATPLGWPDNGIADQNMTYNPTTKKWEIIIALTTGGNEFKFRANDGWELNYGDEGNDGILEFNNGSNMSVPTNGTYKVELDLSSPRNYTWTATLQ